MEYVGGISSHDPACQIHARASFLRDSKDGCVVMVLVLSLASCFIIICEPLFLFHIFALKEKVHLQSQSAAIDKSDAHIKGERKERSGKRSNTIYRLGREERVLVVPSPEEVKLEPGTAAGQRMISVCPCMGRPL